MNFSMWTGQEWWAGDNAFYGLLPLTHLNFCSQYSLENKLLSLG